MLHLLFVVGTSGFFLINVRNAIYIANVFSVSLYYFFSRQFLLLYYYLFFHTKYYYIIIYVLHFFNNII
jgi:hypothetical protein